MTPRDIPLTLYVHLPWCVQKCPYCDFNSYQAPAEIPSGDYVDALIRDLEFDLPWASSRALEAIFIGGGTPSLFEGAAIARLLAAVRAVLPFASDIEITLEANPGTVDEAHFAQYRAAGVNRLSIGVQSFRNSALKRLGRVHDAERAHHAVAVARRAGFDNFNLDLMYGLPGERSQQALHDLEEAIALAPTHLSWYQLTLEDGTAFGRAPPRLPRERQIADEAEAGVTLLARAGYARYEVSAYAARGRQSKHNRNYWEFGDYLGLGAGAHGKLTTAEGVIRTTKRRHPAAYQKQAGTPACREATFSQGAGLVTEFMLNALRLHDGFPPSLFTYRTGLPLSMLTHGIDVAMTRGWLYASPELLQPTPLGYRFLNDLQLLFVS